MIHKQKKNCSFVRDLPHNLRSYNVLTVDNSKLCNDSEKLKSAERYICVAVIKFVECGSIASYYKVFTYTYADPHRPSQ
jgi:hypothetical protein